MPVAMVEVNTGWADVPGGDGFVNDFVHEDVPHTTDARIWAVWSAFDGLGNRVGTLLDFKTRFRSEHWQSPLLILAVLLLVTGVQLFSFGPLAELLMRTIRSQGRPIYRVRGGWKMLSKVT